MLRRPRRFAQRVLQRAFGLLVTLALVAYCAACALAWALYPRLLYPAPSADPDSKTSEARMLTVRAADGTPVDALDFAGPPGAPVLVYFHGNGVVIGQMQWMARELVKRGLGVVLCEYRGYGVSAGTPPTEPASARTRRQCSPS